MDKFGISLNKFGISLDKFGINLDKFGILPKCTVPAAAAPPPAAIARLQALCPLGSTKQKLAVAAVAEAVEGSAPDPLHPG